MLELSHDRSISPNMEKAFAHYSDPLFHEFVHAQYLPQMQDQKRSWKTEKRNLENYILPHLGSYRLSDMSETVLKNWVNTLELTGLSYTSCYLLFWQVKAILNRAVQWGALKDDSGFRKVRMATKIERKPTLLGAKELKRLIGILQDYPSRMPASAILLILYTGAHTSEILYARWDGIDFDKAVLSCSNPKVGHSRLIPLNREALKLIRSLPRKDDIPWLFYTRNGTRIQTVTREWGVIRERFGNPKLRLLDLRHSFTRLLANSGVNNGDLRTILGNYKKETLDFVLSSKLEKE